MTSSKNQPKPATPPKSSVTKGELSETDLHQASGGAVFPSMPANGMCDGSVKTNSALIGLLRTL